MPAKTVLFIFGDSITYGEWDSAGGWANRLRKHFDEKVLPLPKDDYVISYNLGIPSDTSSGLAKRLLQETQARLSPNPDPESIQFIIAIGTNDSRWLIDENKHGVDESTFKENLKTISNSAKTYSNNIAFVGLLPCIEDEVAQTAKRQNWVESFDNQSIEKYNSMIKRHCEETRAEFIDVNNLFKATDDVDLLFSDGLHPNDKGHTLMYLHILEYLENSILV